MAKNYQTPQCKVLLIENYQDIIRTSPGEVGVNFMDVNWSQTILNGGFEDE